MTAISLGHTSGCHGYTNAKPYNIFNTVQDSDSKSTGGDTANTAAAETTTMPVSTMGNTYTTTVPMEITNAIAQLAANQTAMMTQMAALHITPPVQQIQVPIQGAYPNTHGKNDGRVGQGCSGRSYGGRGCGGHGYNAFAELTARNATGGGGQITIPPIAGFNPATTAQNTPNVFKTHNNWNYCFTCGYDFKNIHTSKTCPAE